MKVNFLVLAAAALIPLVIGMLWYNRRTFGNYWMKAADMSLDKAKAMNMPLVFGLTYLFSFFIAFVLCNLSIHQFGVTSLFYKQPINDPTTEMGALYRGVMDALGNSYRTFKHGALHGTFGGLLFAMPIIAINAMFERKSFAYVAVHTGFWMVCLAIMGGIVCAFA